MATIDLDRHLAAIQQGDADAFARWLAGAEQPLRRSLRAFATEVDGEAVLQETLLRVWQVAPRCTPDDKPNGLLRLGLRIARNLAIDHLRRHRACHVELTEGDAPAVEPTLPDDELRAAIARCRDQLPDRPSAALAARIDNRAADPDRTLAERLGMKLNTFLQNITRARRLLADCLRRNGIELDPEAS